MITIVKLHRAVFVLFSAAIVNDESTARAMADSANSEASVVFIVRFSKAKLLFQRWFRAVEAPARFVWR